MAALGALALQLAAVTLGVALQAHAATFLHLGVAEGAAGAIGTAQGHIVQRGPQLLAAAAPVLNCVGFQRVPAGKAAQCQGSRRPSPPQTPSKARGQPGANEQWVDDIIMTTSSQKRLGSRAGWLV